MSATPNNFYEPNLGNDNVPIDCLLSPVKTEQKDDTDVGQHQQPQRQGQQANGNRAAEQDADDSLSAFRILSEVDGALGQNNCDENARLDGIYDNNWDVDL